MIIENQKVYYRLQDDKAGTWKVVPFESGNLNEWCLKQLSRFEYQDSDGDYREYIELDIDGKRYFAIAEYEGWYHTDDPDENTSGSMSSFDIFHSIYVEKYYEYIKPYKYSPYKDYIIVQSWNFRSI